MITYQKKVHKDGHEFIEITGYEGKVTDLVIPSEIENLPVEAVGNHAFSGRLDLRSVTLPESIRTLYGFAFHNCKSLKKISLYDSLDDYYDGVCRQCDALDDIEITVNKSWFEVVRNFLADSDRTLRFLIHIKGEGDACLTFPEYVYDFNENTMARTIQFTIAGSGYAYRECVDRRSIDFREYDKLFSKAVIDGSEISQNIALGRLFYPFKLEDNYRTQYEDFVKNNDAVIIERLVKEYENDQSADRLETVKMLLEYKNEKLLSGNALDKALKSASSGKLTKLSAVLMSGAEGGRDTAGEFVF